MTEQWEIRIRAELPFPADLPRIGHPELGLRNLSTRAGGGQQTLVTLLDTADHRLVRSGVLLAHRISDGTGDWYLSTPDWRGQDDMVAPLDDDGDLPAEFRKVVAPFRRLGTLGPSAALTVERQDYLLRGTPMAMDPAAGAEDADAEDADAADADAVDADAVDAGVAVELGTLRDDRVTVRRSGLTMARFREITITVTSRGMGRAQVDWLEESLRTVGATVVPAFPSLAQRLGAPATGPTDYPDPAGLATGDLTGLVSHWIADGLRGMIAGSDGVAAAELARRLSVLAPALEQPWAADLVTDLGWLATLGTACPGSDPLVGRTDGERALRLLETLVQAVRAPRTARGWPTDTTAAFARLRQQVDEELAGAAPREDDDQSWSTASELAARARDLARLSAEERLDGKRGRHRKRAKRYGALHDQLLGCADPELPHLLADLPELSAEEAFERGREYERRSLEVARRRAGLITQWPVIMDKASV